MLESVVRLNSFLRHLDGLVPLLLGACSSVNVKTEEIALTDETPYFVSPLVWLIPGRRWKSMGASARVDRWYLYHQC